MRGPMTPAREPWILYELPLSALLLQTAEGDALDFTGALSNGRANYILFQALVGRCTGLAVGTEGAGSDLAEGHEVKAYPDPALFPDPRHDLFHTAASATFGPNNRGKEVNALVARGDYAAALEICRVTGYDKNAAYIYTNTARYSPQVPFRYLIVPTADVLSLLDPRDPRLISRASLLERVTRTELIRAEDLK